jgi:2-polyprenyl-3-methyl-5-hydroxy-6-metoxy-1,4-benzoquinol methylase
MDQHIWNQRWSDRDSHDGWRVDSWLKKQHGLLTQGTALDIACGRGRNALYLARNNYRVSGIDYSDVALQQLNEAAASQGLKIETLQADLEQQPQLPQGPFDLIINFYFLQRPLIPQLKERVKPGGLLILRTFSEVVIDEPCCLGAAMYLQQGELLKTFADWQILVYEEGIETSKKGGSLVGIVARKPQT